MANEPSQPRSRTKNFSIVEKPTRFLSPVVNSFWLLAFAEALPKSPQRVLMFQFEIALQSKSPTAVAHGRRHGTKRLHPIQQTYPWATSISFQGGWTRYWDTF